MDDEIDIGDFRENRLNVKCRRENDRQFVCRVTDKKTNDDIVHQRIAINDPREEGGLIGFYNTTFEVFSKGLHGKIKDGD